MASFFVSLGILSIIGMQSVSDIYAYYSLMKVPTFCKLSMPVYIDRRNMLGSRSCSLYIFMIISLDLPIQTLK